MNTEGKFDSGMYSFDRQTLIEHFALGTGICMGGLKKWIKIHKCKLIFSYQQHGRCSSIVMKGWISHVKQNSYLPVKL